MWNLHPFLDLEISEALLDSIAHVGLLHPPLVISVPGNGYDILCGRKRIGCAQELGAGRIFCTVLPQDTPVTTRLTLLVAEQMTVRPLSLPEAATFYHLCLSHLEKDQAADLLPHGFPHRESPARLLRLLEFTSDILQGIHNGLLTERIVSDLLSFNDKDRARIVKLITTLQLGANKQRRLIGLLKDITQRDGTPLTALLSRRDLTEIIYHKEMNIPQKTGRLLDLLHKIGFPRSTAAKEEFEAEIRKLSLPEAVSISASPFFERDEVTLSVRFPDLDSCQTTLPPLLDLLRHPLK